MADSSEPTIEETAQAAGVSLEETRRVLRREFERVKGFGEKARVKRLHIIAQVAGCHG